MPVAAYLDQINRVADLRCHAWYRGFEGGRYQDDTDVQVIPIKLDLFRPFLAFQPDSFDRIRISLCPHCVTKGLRQHIFIGFLVLDFDNAYSAILIHTKHVRNALLTASVNLAVDNEHIPT